MQPSFRSRSPRHLPAVILVMLTVGAAGLAGCGWNHPDRHDNLAALARWEDRRLAPQDSLETMLAHQDAHVRLAAARTAGLIGRSDVLPALVELLNDRSRTVAAQAAFSLGLLGDAAAVDELTRAARSSHAAVRLAALEGLAHLPHDGAVLMEATLAADPQEAAAAWDGLRNVADRADSSALHQAYLGGLESSHTDVLWRVLRCVERTPWPVLLPQVTGHASSAHPQVRVHALRALARLPGPEALEVVVASGRSEGVFRDRHRDRVDIALMRALGSLGHHELGLDPDRENEARDFLVTELIKGAGHANPHVAVTALAAMENIVQDQPLPPEAARQESLLPVWRIRLARAASSHLDHPEPQVRAAAVRAWALLRGSGAGPKVEQVLDAGPDDRVAAAAIFAISRIHPMPLRTLDRFTAPDSPAPALARTAALEGTVHVFLQRVRALPQDMTPAFVIDRLTAATADSDFVVAATGAELLAGYPSRQTVIALAELWDRASGPESADLRLAVMGALQAMGPAVAALERPDTTGYGVDHLLEITRDLLREAFDAADLRLRNRGREAALATGLLPDNLIPSEASLLATLPAFRRSAEQAQLVLPFDAPEVRCVTDRGSFTIALDADIAPNTCASFLDLIERGFYQDLSFHRVVPDFVAQGGCPRGDGWGGPGYTIRSEWSRVPYERGTVGIAHSGKDTGGSQFFVTLSEQPHLNGRYTVFGKVTGGMEVVDRICAGDRFRLEIVR